MNKVIVTVSNDGSQDFWVPAHETVIGTCIGVRLIPNDDGTSWFWCSAYGNGKEATAPAAWAAAVKSVRGSLRGRTLEEKAMKVSVHDIIDLRCEAVESGDTEQVLLCNAALAGDVDARAECVEAIRTAWASDDRPEGEKAVDWARGPR